MQTDPDSPHGKVLASLYRDNGKYAPPLRFYSLGLPYIAFLTFRGTVVPNPLADPIFFENWINHLSCQREGAIIWGDYLENRGAMWKGTYLDQHPGAADHLGIDVWFSEGTPICCPVPFSIEHAWRDPDQRGGWGGRVVVSTNRGRVVFAHLVIDNWLFDSKVGTQFPAGTCLGAVAPIHLNGNWAPHLHLQGLRDDVPLDGLDGYGPARADNSVLYPNPLDILAHSG